MTGTLPIRRALISVSEKRGLVELGRALADRGIEILSTGGSARALTEAGIEVLEVSDHTGFPEIMDGRVKTLHPKIHGGILARTDLDDAESAEHGLSPIDLVVVNLYPFGKTVDRPDCTLHEAIENIDIGGPALLRAAAKNHARVTVLCRPEDYGEVLGGLPQAPDADRRRRLATTAFAHTAAYDGRISQWLAQFDAAGALPPVVNLNLDLATALRYGENPHQAAGLYRARASAARGLAGCEPLQGKALSFNNLLDADVAWKGVRTLGDQPACMIVKHNNPCGAAIAENTEAAYRLALACDPISAFGGIIAFNRPIDDSCAKAVTAQFVEVLIAPGFQGNALETLAARPNVRVLSPEPGAPVEPGLDVRAIEGGWLVQSPDELSDRPEAFRTATRRAPDDEELSDLNLAWRVVKLVRSNAIVLARNGATVGIGAGQMSRVDSARIAALKAADAKLDLRGAVMASDAFIPFADSIETAAAAGIRAIIQPGGSRRDDEVIAAADAHGMAMILTGRRHFRH